MDVYQATVADSAQTLLKVRGTNDAQLRVEGANDNTSVGYGTNRSGGALILRNTNSTVGNYESICFSNANNYINAGIHGINVAHGEGNATRGKIEIWTRNTANNYHKALEISDSSAVTFHTSTGAVAYTLPNSDGNAGYHLETNGSGTVTWAAGGAGTVTSITAGDGLSGGTITTSGTIANTDKGSSQNIFKKVRTSNSVGNQLGLSTANSNDDTIDFRQGTGITLATSGDVVTITATNTTAGTVTGTGTANSISKWTGTSSQGNSTISDNGSIVTVANDFHIYKVGADKQLWLSEGTSGSGATNVQLNPNGVSYLRGGSVGIGTSIPGYRLEVKESSATWLSRIYNTGTGNGLLVRVDSGSSDAIFSTHNGTAHLLVVKGDGNVGIGTYTPTTLFESNVNSASVGTDSVTARNSGVTTIGHSVGYRYQFNTAVPAASRAILEHTNSGRSRLGFFVSTDGAVGNLTEYLSIKSDGVVDINSAKLKINGGSGTDGQVLTTDGAGGIAWETNGSGTVTGTGTAGKITKWSGTSAATDSSFLSESATTLTSTSNIIDCTTSNFQLRLSNYGRVGVGTNDATSPFISYLADSSTFSGDHALIRAYNAGNRGAKGHASGSNLFKLDFSDACAMIVNKDGNVGIGTDGPVAQLNLFEAGADDAISSSLYFQRAAGHYGCAILQVGNGSAGTEKLMFTAGHNSNPVAIGNAKMTIQQDGNVGIGTNDPSRLLDVYDGNVRIFQQTAAAELLIGSGGTGAATLILDGSNGDGAGLDYFYISQNNDLSTDIATPSSGGVIKLTSKGSLAQTLDGSKTTFGGNVVLGNVESSINPLTDSTYDIGSNTGRWANVFADTLYGAGSNITALNATNLSSGTVNTARLGTGTADSSTFLRGDNTWVANANGTVTSITAGSGLSGGTITTSGTIANTDKGSSQNIFKKVRTSNSVGTQLGLSTANSNDDTIDFRQGTGITLATSGDVVTITATNTTVGTVTSSGTAGYIPRLSTSTNIANSIIYEETGKILLNGTTALGPFGHWSWTPTFQQLGTQGIASVRCAADVYGGALQLVSARGSNASPTIVLDNDRAGGVYFHAYDGVDFKNSAGAIECFIDGTPGADDTPGRLVFSTTPDGSNGFAEQMRIQSDGNVGIGTDAPAAWLQIKKDSNNSGNQFSVADTEGASAAVRTYTHGGDPSALILNHYYAVGGSSNEYMRYADIVANVSNGAGTTIRFITKNAANAYSATVIDNEGNVEIGATQAYKFTGSTAKISQQNNNDLNLYASDDINIKTRYARFYNGSTEHARIAINGSWVTGHFYPIANGTQDLGKTDKRWNNVYSEAGNFSGRVIAGDFEMLDLGGTGRTLAVRDGASNTVKIGDGVNFVTFRFNATQVAPNNNNNCILGASSLRWSTIYGVLGNFSGAVTWSGGGSANANTAYTYSQVGHLPLAGGTLTGLLTSRAITPSADSTYNLGENTVRYANIFGDTAYLGNADGTGLLLGVAAFGGATNQRLQIGATLAGSSSATAQIAGLTRVGYIITHNTSEGIRPNADGQSTCGTNVQRWSTVYGQAANFNGALTAGSGTFAGSVTPSVDSTYDLGENTNRWTNIFGDNIYGNGANLTSLNASALSSGTVPTARLGTGTADSSTFLRGDNTWVANAGGTVTSVTAGTGMTQSGTSTINPTLNVIGGTGITANANDIAITNTAVSAGSYTYASITVDAQGRLTAASSGSAPGGGTVTGTGTDNYVPRWNGTTALQNSALFSDDNDNVGIGTTTPNTHGWADKALTIYDSSGTNKYTAVEILGKGTGGGAVLFGNQTLLRASIYGGNGSYLSFSTNSNNSGTTMVEKMRILSDGNVGIGTNNPSKLLDVNGTSYFRDDIYFGNTVLNPASGFSNQTGMGWDKSTGELQIASSTTVLELGRHSSTGTIFSCRYGSMQKASIDTSGNMSLAGTLSESSSIAIKENVETYSPSLENISKMRPVRFNKKKSKKKEVGLVAEELAEMFPELVETDKDGKPSGVNYSRAVAVLLHGFKELYKEVKELKEKI